MASEVDVANDALTHLGRSRITSLNDSNEEARVMKQFFDGSVDAVLQDYPYRCARYLAELSKLATAPTWGYDHAYQLPTSPYCLRVLDVLDADSDYTWQRFGRNLHTDLDTCKIEYVGRTDVSALDPLVNVAVASYLAFRAAYALTQSRSMVADMWNLYKSDRQEARTADGLQGSTRKLTMSSFRTVRRSGTN